MTRYVSTATIAVSLFAVNSLPASEDTIGPNGINSVVLNNNGLNGMGIKIGQVEGFRAGKFNHDTDANCCNQEVVPAFVFARDIEAVSNEMDSGEHALWVASVMISQQTDVTDGVGTSPPDTVSFFL
jgi:hypothetical protein